MTHTKLRGIIGIGLVAVHFLILVLVGILAALDRFTQDEMFISFGMIAPLFAAITTLVVKAYVEEKPGPAVTILVGKGRAVLSILVVAMFASTVVLAILWKAFGTLTFDGLVKVVGTIETGLGAYVGMVVQSLFGPIVKRSK